MNILKIVFVWILVCFCFCGCVDTPDSLKEDPTKPVTGSNTVVLTEEDDSTPQTENTSATVITQVERGSLDEIRNQLSLDLQKTYKNITITGVRVSEADAMPTYDIKIGKQTDYDFTKLVEYLYGDRFDCSDEKLYKHSRKGELIDPETDLTPIEQPTFDKDKNILRGINVYSIDIESFSPDYNTDMTLSAFSYSIGNVWGSQSGGGSGRKIEDWYLFERHGIYKKYDLGTESPSNDEIYIMADGKEWGVMEAIKFVEGFWNEYIAPSDPASYTYTAKTLWIIDLGENKYGYLFSMQRQDENGNYFDVDFTDYYFADSNTVTNNEPFVFTNRLYTYCAQKEVLNRFTKDYSFSYNQATDQGNNLLSLGAASDLLSETLAPNIGLKLTAELNYVVMCKGYPYFQIWEYPAFYEHVCLSECDFEIRPVWCFRPEDQCYLMNSVEAERYFVDAVTGEVSTIVRNVYQKDNGIGQSSGW